MALTRSTILTLGLSVDCIIVRASPSPVHRCVSGDLGGPTTDRIWLCLIGWLASAMNVRIKLSGQEYEFALACRDFVSEKDVAASRAIELVGDEMIIADDDRIFDAFITYGVARLMKVFHLAIENKAIPLEEVPHLIVNLAAFNEKVMSVMVTPKRNLLQ